MLKKFTWAHGIMLALGGFIVFILSMIFFFTRGWQNAELVSNDYYEEELHYQAIIDAKNNADGLAVKPVYKQTSEGIVVHFPEEIKPENGKIDFQLFRTDDAKLDVNKTLPLDAQQSITIPKSILFPGSYTLKVKWKQQSKPYQIDYDVLWK
ncbi:FixH family protein [Bergeyella sp. RCAD1439]|uniref:FixH family protein n=1 Tax=Bergeyella anatis TaxID=3113737 RepID=UPI002E178DAA|nr:FixH family protein [Bergeyella sp. RCAD1439]